MMPYCTSYFKFLFEWFWGFPEQNKDFAVFRLMRRLLCIINLMMKNLGIWTKFLIVRNATTQASDIVWSLSSVVVEDKYIFGFSNNFFLTLSSACSSTSYSAFAACSSLLFKKSISTSKSALCLVFIILNSSLRFCRFNSAACLAVVVVS